MEKDRNMKIFSNLQKKKELGVGQINETKMAKVAQKKHDKARKYSKQ